MLDFKGIHCESMIWNVKKIKKNKTFLRVLISTYILMVTEIQVHPQTVSRQTSHIKYSYPSFHSFQSDNCILKLNKFSFNKDHSKLQDTTLSGSFSLFSS